MACSFDGFSTGIYLVDHIMKILNIDLEMFYNFEDESVDHLLQYSPVQKLPSLIGAEYFA